MNIDIAEENCNTDNHKQSKNNLWSDLCSVAE